MKHARHASIAFLVVCGAFFTTNAFAQQVNCTDVPQSMPLGNDALAPVAAELRPIIAAQLGSPTGVLAQAYDQAMSADMVVLRLRVETCRKIASTLPSPSSANPNDPATYKPKSEFDNTPWRFNMEKGMTAAEFEAWMKAKGLHVSKGPPKPEATPATDGQGQPAGNVNPQQTPAPPPAKKP